MSIDSMNFASFDEAFDTVFRQNPCISLSSLLQNQDEVNDCAQIAISSFSHGLTTFNSYFSNRIKDKLFHTESAFGTVSYADIYEFARANYYGNKFVVYLMNVWSDDIISYLDSQFFFLVIYISVSILVLLIVFFIVSEI